MWTRCDSHTLDADWLSDPSRPCFSHTLTRVADGSLNLMHQQKRGRGECVGDGGAISMEKQDEGEVEEEERWLR